MLRHILFIVCLVAALTACSGGSSSGGRQPSGTHNSPHVGSYAGQLEVTTSNQRPVNTSEAISVYIQPNGQVAISNSDTLIASGPLLGDGISISVPLAMIAGDPSCAGDLLLIATVTTDAISGTLSTTTNAQCGNGPVTLTGTVAAQLESTQLDTHQYSTVIQGPSKAISTAIQ